MGIAKNHRLKDQQEKTRRPVATQPEEFLYHGEMSLNSWMTQSKSVFMEFVNEVSFIINQNRFNSKIVDKIQSIYRLFYPIQRDKSLILSYLSHI